MARGIPPEVERLLKQLEPRIRRAFIQAAQDVTSNVTLKQLADQIRTGSVASVLRTLNLDPALLQPLERAVNDAFFEGGVWGIAALGAVSDPFTGNRLVIRFNGRHPRAEQWLARKSSELIDGGILDDQRNVVRLILRSGAELGRGPDKVARDLIGTLNKATGRRTGGVLMLHSRQAQAVARAREQLTSGNPAEMAKYLRRKRRDRRFDSVVKRAIKAGKPVKASDVDKVTRRYSDRLLQYRGEVVARTEGITALRAGRREGVKQVVDSGAIQDDQVERRWDDSADAKVRPAHSVLNGQVVRGTEEPFVAPGGDRLMFPGDTSLGAAPELTILCRCFENIRVRFIR